MSIAAVFLSPWAVLAALIAWIFYPYFVTYGALRHIPGPRFAGVSNLWLLMTQRRGKRYQLVDEAHKKYGKVMRVQPNHVSINSDAAINIIYGHGNGFLKSEFYDAFVSIRRGLFNTRSRQEHTRKRKIIAHTFSVKSIGEFEPYMHTNLELFVAKWDELIKATDDKQGYALVDCLNWFNYLAFDVIGDLAFGAPFGMLAAGADVAEVRDSPTSPPKFAPAVEILNRRGEVSATLGCFPQLKPYARWLPDPFFSQGLSAVNSLAGIAIAAVRRRFDAPPTDRTDLLARLMQGRDEKGEPMGREELTAEALTQLIAGSDTTSNSSCAILYHVIRTPGVLAKLRAELEAAIPDDVVVPTFDMVKALPYLQACINEALRIHSPSGIGLPRDIPMTSSGVEIDGYFFPPGTTLSVPTYSIHHSKDIWGADADEYRPERWEKATDRQKNAFIPFSYGPRACVGRNVAEMELKLIVGTWARRYDIVLKQDVMETREGFLRKPLALDIGFKLRA